MTLEHDRFLARWSRRKREASRIRADTEAGAAPQRPAEPDTSPPRTAPALAGPCAYPDAAASSASPDPHPAASARPDASADSPANLPGSAGLVQPGTGEPAPLPPVETLTPESDFRPFMRTEVDDTTRNAALARLFADPHFSASDGLDVYIEDYGKTEPIPATLLARLKQLHEIGATPVPDVEPTRSDVAQAPAPEVQSDAPSGEPREPAARGDEQAAAAPPQQSRNRSTSERDDAQ